MKEELAHHLLGDKQVQAKEHNSLPERFSGSVILEDVARGLGRHIREEHETALCDFQQHERGGGLSQCSLSFDSRHSD